MKTILVSSGHTYTYKLDGLTREEAEEVDDLCTIECNLETARRLKSMIEDDILKAATAGDYAEVIALTESRQTIAEALDRVETYYIGKRAEGQEDSEE